MAVQHFDHKQAQELLFAAGGNQHRKRRSIACGAFLGVVLIWWRLFSKSRVSRLIAGGVVVWLEQLTLYALALSRATGLRPYDFKCAWFSDDTYCEFFPLHVVHKLPPKRR